MNFQGPLIVRYDCWHRKMIYIQHHLLELQKHKTVFPGEHGMDSGHLYLLAHQKKIDPAANVIADVDPLNENDTATSV